jgi:hypothetical protein
VKVLTQEVGAVNASLQQTVAMPSRAAPRRLTLGRAGRAAPIPVDVLMPMRRHQPSGVFGGLDCFLATGFLLGKSQVCRDAERKANGAKNCCDLPHRLYHFPAVTL